MFIISYLKNKAKQVKERAKQHIKYKNNQITDLGIQSH